MKDFKLFEAEYKLADIVWEHEPIPSPKLVLVCAERLGWKKSTTYTMLRRLCDRGILKNEDTTVIALVGREQAQKYESEALLERSFDGSIPSFIATFLRDRRLSKQEADELHRMIEEASK